MDLPLSLKSIDSKWLFGRKYNMDGFVQTFEARLIMTKDFKQRE